jgi:rubrerythrin
MLRDLTAALAMAEIATIETGDRALTAERHDITQLPLSRFSCDGCGYGASSRIAPERCPMCGGSVWSLERRSRLTDAADAPLTRDPLS